MKTKIFILFVSVFLLILGFAPPWGQAYEDKPYVAPQEYFSTWFPTSPTIIQNTEKTELGATGKNIYTSEDKGIYAVEYSILPVILASLESPENIYNSAVKHFLAQKGATQVSLSNVTVQGNPAKQLVYRMSNGTPGTARFILAGRRFYVVSATTTYGSWARSFLASFKML
jgi:hypothetical protein